VSARPVVFILGAGRVGTALARALRTAGVAVAGVHGRRAAGPPESVTSGALPSALAGATVVLVAVRDGQLEEALAELGAGPLAAGAVILHVSGSADPAALAALRGRGHPAGTFHPLLPFADPERAAASIRGIWFGVDGDEAAQAEARELAAALGARTLVIPAGEKVRYHAAAVFASNFPALLMASGERLLTRIGLAPAEARDALLPLFNAAVENVRARPSAQALTGPIVRGDTGTVQRHLAALDAEPELLAFYRALVRAALPLARQAGTDGTRLAEIAALIDG
jgi:predicted short-subunit dehydrogenase-like oxidoreductase (DUF2520 family)